jgi:dihydrofolate reductase
MGKLIYASNMSLDGWTEDRHGGFDWAPPGDEVFASVTGLMASAGTYLYGRRMYELMALWETDPSLAHRSPLTDRYAQVWQAPDKVVFSSTLGAPLTERTRIERQFDLEAVRRMKVETTHDLLVGGPHLAAQALTGGMVDEVVLYVWPVVLGGRNPALPGDLRIDLALIDEHLVGSGVVRLRYAVQPST